VRFGNRLDQRCTAGGLATSQSASSVSIASNVLRENEVLGCRGEMRRAAEEISMATEAEAALYEHTVAL
jgi:hypothetical protein